MRARAALPAGAALVLASAAALGGPFDLKGTQPHDLDTQTLPEDTFNKCSSCHAGGTDDNNQMFRPWDTWAGTMMANAARDPLFLAALTVAEQDVPGAGTYCLRCHTPQAFVRGDATPGFGAALTDDDKQGVACEACHRSTDPSMSLNGNPPVDPSGPYVGNAQLFWDPGPQKHGPYDMADSPAHTTLLDNFESQAELCGQCHEVANPAVHQLDDQGNDTGRPFPLDTTYTEWKNSAFGDSMSFKSCIDCHMPAATGALTLSTFPTAQVRISPLTHVFTGGNVWGIDAVRASDATLSTDRALFFNAARLATVATLASAVKLELSMVPVQASPGDTLAIGVRVTNQAGHKFPTGYADGRRAWVRVEVLDVDMKSLAVIGDYDDAKRAIVPDPELRVYEAVHEAMQSGSPALSWHIAKSNHVAKDTRIPPPGFLPGPTTAIIGADYSDGNGGINAFDEGTYHMTIPAGTKGTTLTVRASVMYQSTVTEMIDALAAADTTDARGTTLQQIYAMTGYAAPSEIATAQTSVTLLNGGVGSTSSSSGAGGGSGGSGGGGTGGGGGGGKSGGCGCSVDGEGAAYGPALLVAALAALRRRKRRREA